MRDEFPIKKSNKFPDFPAFVPWEHAEKAFKTKLFKPNLDHIAEKCGGWYVYEFIFLYNGIIPDC